VHYCFVDILGYIFAHTHNMEVLDNQYYYCVCVSIHKRVYRVSNLFESKGQNRYVGMIHGPHVEKKITISVYLTA